MLKVTDYLRIFWTYDNLKQENVLEKMRFVLKICCISQFKLFKYTSCLASTAGGCVNTLA